MSEPRSENRIDRVVDEVLESVRLRQAAGFLKRWFVLLVKLAGVLFLAFLSLVALMHIFIWFTSAR